MTSRSNDRNIDPGNRARLLTRLLERDTTLWSDDPDTGASIEQRLGWLDAIDFSRAQLDRIVDFAGRVRRDGFDRVVLLGMGGSSLAPEVFNQCFAGSANRLDMTVLDTTFPDTVERTSHTAGEGRPLVIVSSKSGSTAETAALFQYFREWCRDRFGDRWGDHFVAITDAGSSLHETAMESNFRGIFLNPADIGGRYSALSLFGLVPASLAGVDISLLLDRAQRMLDGGDSTSDAVDLGIVIGEGVKAGRDKLALAFSPGLKSLGLWIEQLVAESTGKQDTGVVPFVDVTTTNPLRFPDECALVATRLAGEAPPDHGVPRQGSLPGPEDRPVISITVDDPHELGAEFMRWQIATAVAAAVMGVNPFDEPDVNATKQATSQILRDGSRSNSSALAAAAFDPATFENFLDQLDGHGYVALLAYLPTDQDWEEKLLPLGLRLQRHLDTVTCLSLGPRYLHSSGQLHKGGRKYGHFLMLTAEPGRAVPVPGAPYDFGSLIEAQARGDIEVLRMRGQNVLHIDLGPIGGAEEKVREIESWLDRHQQGAHPRSD